MQNQTERAAKLMPEPCWSNPPTLPAPIKPAMGSGLVIDEYREIISPDIDGKDARDF
jgi:hypothetical protein